FGLPGRNRTPPRRGPQVTRPTPLTRREATTLPRYLPPLPRRSLRPGRPCPDAPSVPAALAPTLPQARSPLPRRSLRPGRPPRDAPAHHVQERQVVGRGR